MEIGISTASRRYNRIQYGIWDRFLEGNGFHDFGWLFPERHLPELRNLRDGIRLCTNHI